MYKRQTKSLSEIFRLLRAKGCLVNNCKTCSSQNNTDVKSKTSQKAGQSSPRKSLGKAKRTSRQKSLGSFPSTPRAAGAAKGQGQKTRGASPPKKPQAQLPKQIKSDNSSFPRGSCDPCGNLFETDPKRIQNEISLQLERTRASASQNSQPTELPQWRGELEEKKEEDEQRAEHGDGPVGDGEKSGATSSRVPESCVPLHNYFLRCSVAERRRSTGGRKGEGSAMEARRHDERKTACSAEPKRGLTEAKDSVGLAAKTAIETTAPMKRPTLPPQPIDTNVNFSISSPPSDVFHDAPTPPNSPVLQRKWPARSGLLSRSPLVRRGRVYKQLDFLCKASKVTNIRTGQRLCDSREKRSRVVPLRLARIELQDGSDAPSAQSDEVNWFTAARDILLRRVAIASLMAPANNLQSKRDMRLRLGSQLRRFGGSSGTMSCAELNNCARFSGTARKGRASEGHGANSRSELSTAGQRVGGSGSDAFHRAQLMVTAGRALLKPTLRSSKSSDSAASPRDASMPRKATISMLPRFTNRARTVRGNFRTRVTTVPCDYDSDNQDTSRSGENISTNCATSYQEDLCYLKGDENGKEPAIATIQRDVSWGNPMQGQALDVEVTPCYTLLQEKRNRLGHQENERRNYQYFSCHKVCEFCSWRPAHHKRLHLQASGRQSGEELLSAVVNKLHAVRHGNLSESDRQAGGPQREEELHVTVASEGNPSCPEKRENCYYTASTQ